MYISHDIMFFYHGREWGETRLNKRVPKNPLRKIILLNIGSSKEMFMKEAMKGLRPDRNRGERTSWFFLFFIPILFDIDFDDLCSQGLTPAFKKT